MSPFSRRLQQAIVREFVVGVTKPSASNTGPRSATFTVINGDYIASTAGMTITGLDIHGNLKITANNITIQDCIIRGRGNNQYISGFSPFLV
jgi:hypothetical protein